MTKNTGAIVVRIGLVLEMVEAGTYSINELNGAVSKGDKEIKGSIGSEDGQRWYSLKGLTVQGQRLCYAYYHGLNALDTDKVVKHLDGDKLNNGKHNIVQVNKVGWKKELDAMREGLGLVEVTPIEVTEAEQQDPRTLPHIAPTVEEVVPAQTNDLWKDKDYQARKIWMELVNGATIKEVAEAFGVTTSRVYDVKRRKSNAKATADLPAIV